MELDGKIYEGEVHGKRFHPNECKSLMEFYLDLVDG